MIRSNRDEGGGERAGLTAGWEGGASPALCIGQSKLPLQERKAIKATLLSHTNRGSKKDKLKG